MSVAVYGSKGIPVLGFPTQDSPCTNYEEFGMVDEMADFIDSGSIQLFCVDTVDVESWSALDSDKAQRAERQEQYFHYIVDEVLPLMRKENKSRKQPLVMGFSLGGTHAAITFLRRPDLFSAMLAISGVYDAGYFFGDWMNDTLYNNSPTAFIPHMPLDHPYIELYNSKKMIFCVGRGAWEDEGVRTLEILGSQLSERNIHAWTDFWGFDVNHDWPWWKKMVRYFLPQLLAKAPAHRRTGSKK